MSHKIGITACSNPMHPSFSADLARLCQILRELGFDPVLSPCLYDNGSGFSGAGKGTVLSQVLARRPDLYFSVSFTTRPPREGEKDGGNYHFVTRQAVSRWETGETTPNVETLKLLSTFFNVSINTLLGSPRQLICQCCGMPLEDSITSKEPDGSFNEDYCMWCYTDGKFAYCSGDALLAFLVPHMSNDAWPPEQVRAYLADMLPKLKHWAK